MTSKEAKNIVRGITDKIEATTDIDDWAEFWGFTRDDYEEFLEMPIKLLEQEPCGDAISRQAVLDMLEDINAETDGVGFYYEHYVEYIKNLSPVTPKPTKLKTAHWVYKIYGGFHEQGDWYCSHCDYQFNYGNGHTKHCPECGYEMSEPSTEEVIGDRDYDWVTRR